MNGRVSAAGRPLRVVHLVPSGAVGGIQRLLIDLCAAQRKAGLIPMVAFGSRTGGFVPLFEDAGVATFDVELESRHLGPRRVAEVARALGHNDIVHMHDFSPAAARIAARLRRPLVYTEHIPLHITGTPRRAAQRVFMHRCDRVVAVSEHTKSQLVRLLKLPGDVISVVHNGLSFEGSELKDPPARPNDELSIGTVGRLDPWKRTHLLIDAVALMESRDRVRSVIVGDGEGFNDLQGMIRRVGLGAKIRMVGARTDVRSIYRDIDVLVHPAQREPFGLVLLEAMAHGVLPVVLADGGGALEVIPEDGIVATDARDLARCLDLLRGSPVLSLEARIRRSKWVKEAFPIEQVATRYLEIYRTMLMRRSAAI